MFKPTTELYMDFKFTYAFNFSAIVCHAFSLDLFITAVFPFLLIKYIFTSSYNSMSCCSTAVQPQRRTALCSVGLLHDYWSSSRSLWSISWSFKGIHERAISLVWRSWLAKSSTSQPGLAFVELNKPDYTEQACQTRLCLLNLVYFSQRLWNRPLLDITDINEQ